MTRRYFTPLDENDLQQLAHAAYLKGLLNPFKGKGSLEVWANQCSCLRDGLISLAESQVLAQARRYPFNLLPVQLAQQVTGAGTTFLRWRNLDRTSMGVSLWEQCINNDATPNVLIDDLLALELQRIVLNMQISLTHTLCRQAVECVSKMARAEAAHQHCSHRRVITQENTL
ncbi:DUF3158 family protein [Pseudomonas synxantha]|uniref:Uncharacterized protein n=1 Tax=Pseudomonas synxantha TaxID=47883 RepID=A0ACC6JVV1_9PSED|nr:DUF3158 family protein [Pseudomonas synxantha]MDR6610541.1 hypothetical protein [Pseudomonas synxantha]